MIVDEPADRRDPGDGQPADVRQQHVRPRDQQQGLPGSSLKNPDKPLLNHAINEQFPPGSTYKLVTGLRCPRRQEARPDDAGPDQGATSRSARIGSGTGTTAASARCDIYCGFGHSSDTFFYQMAGMLGIDRLALLGAASSASGRRPGSTCRARSPASSRRTSGSRTRSASADLPRRGLPGRDRAGLRRRHAAPDPQRLRGPGQRRQALPAAGRPRGRRRRTAPSSGRSSRSCIRKLKATAERPQDHAARRPQRRPVRHTFNLVDLPIVVAGKSGTAEFGVARHEGPPAVPLLVRRLRAEGPYNGNFAKARLRARRPRLRLRLAHRRATRRPRSSSTTSSSTSTSSTTTATRPPQARQLLPRRD